MRLGSEQAILFIDGRFEMQQSRRWRKNGEAVCSAGDPHSSTVTEPGRGNQKFCSTDLLGNRPGLSQTVLGCVRTLGPCRPGKVMEEVGVRAAPPPRGALRVCPGLCRNRREAGRHRPADPGQEDLHLRQEKLRGRLPSVLSQAHCGSALQI